MYKSTIIRAIASLLLTISPIYSQDVGDLIICIDASGSMRFQFPGASGTCGSLISVNDPNSRYFIVRSALATSITMLGDYVGDAILHSVTDGNVAVVRFPGREPNVTETILPLTNVSTVPLSNPFAADIPNLLNNPHDTDVTKKMHIACNMSGVRIIPHCGVSIIPHFFQ